MRKGDLFEGLVLRTDFPCKGIVEFKEETGALAGGPREEERYRAVVKGALEGQKVRFALSRKKGGRLEGRLLDVVEKSSVEITPPCPHFGSCGGCSYQNLSYQDQLALKKRQVEELIRKSGHNFEIEKIYKSPVTRGYRNKMELTFGDETKGGPLALGMHKKGSFHDIVSLSDCRIMDPDCNVLAQVILKYFDEKGLPFYHRLRHEGYLRHLVIRRSAKTGAVLLNLVTSSQGSFDEEDFVRTVLDAKKENRIDGTIAGILHTINDRLADAVISDETRILYGQDYIYEYLYNLRFKISPFSFFQTNTLGAEVLYDRVREYAGDTRDKLIYDLYSGTGTIAQLLAPAARKVVGVEIVEEAVEAAMLNARDNQLTNCEFIAGDVLKVVDALTRKPDILILDPPRDGINPRALKKIIGFGVEEIVYVSCKPTSLMRDLVILKEAGYNVERACLVDMFPSTANIETVVKLGMR